jgi:DNA (cytosine-5)-methyltransferase 1
MTKDQSQAVECADPSLTPGSGIQANIPNHFSPALSALDLAMVRAVPPGGNWKNIPKSIPSERLQQIRESFAAGEGSRSTYYGRLRPDAPAYTIGTYFNRPGNGCYIHFDYDNGQHRLISQREAARLQSFPDSFFFCGSRRLVNEQIGNAVPPILAYHIAQHIGEQGTFVDLFCGAGGLSLGFVWAGWVPILGNDINETFLETYELNLKSKALAGDIRSPAVFEQIVSVATRRNSRSGPIFFLGGPPCQGFSTAGERRSIDDRRNALFGQYVQMLTIVRPDGFLFENVPGIANMMRGKVFESIKREFVACGYEVNVWKLNAEQYGVPQRRTRIFLMGVRPGSVRAMRPSPITAFPEERSLLDSLPPSFSVKEALDDLPPIEPGQDGSHLEYVHEPSNSYQTFLRGRMTAEELIIRLKGQAR